MGKHLKGESDRSYGDGRGTGYKNPPGPKWKQGQSGNVGGKRKSMPKRSIREEFAEASAKLLFTEVDLGDEKVTLLHAYLAKMLKEGSQSLRHAIPLLSMILKYDANQGAASSRLNDNLGEDEARILADARARASRSTLSIDLDDESAADE